MKSIGICFRVDWVIHFVRLLPALAVAQSNQVFYTASPALDWNCHYEYPPEPASNFEGLGQENNDLLTQSAVISNKKSKTDHKIFRPKRALSTARLPITRQESPCCIRLLAARVFLQYPVKLKWRTLPNHLLQQKGLSSSIRRRAVRCTIVCLLTPTCIPLLSLIERPENRSTATELTIISLPIFPISTCNTFGGPYHHRHHYYFLISLTHRSRFTSFHKFFTTVYRLSSSTQQSLVPWSTCSTRFRLRTAPNNIIRTTKTV